MKVDMALKQRNQTNQKEEIVYSAMAVTKSLMWQKKILL